jgi:hypothetical protein
MLSFELDKSNKFQFSMEIFGENDTGAAPIVEFKIKTDSAAFSFPAIPVENSVYEVSVPALGSMIKPGTYITEVVVILGDRYFVPLSENVEVKAPLKPVISNFKANNAPAAAPKVSVEFVKKEEKAVVSSFKPVESAKPQEAPIVEEPKVEVQAPEIKPETKVKPAKATQDPLLSTFWNKFSPKK